MADNSRRTFTASDLGSGSEADLGSLPSYRSQPKSADVRAGYAGAPGYQSPAQLQASSSPMQLDPGSGSSGGRMFNMSSSERGGSEEPDHHRAAQNATRSLIAMMNSASEQTSTGDTFNRSATRSFNTSDAERGLLSRFNEVFKGQNFSGKLFEEYSRDHQHVMDINEFHDWKTKETDCKTRDEYFARKVSRSTGEGRKWKAVPDDS